MIKDKPLDIIKSFETDPKRGIILKVFLDDRGLLYEGSLRLNESDPDKEGIIALSQFRRYVKNEEGRFILKNDYNKDNSRWVVIKEKDVTRIEVKFGEPK